MFLEWGLLGLFLICFLSATILPFPSEAALIYFLTSNYSVGWVIGVASLGNILGGWTNYLLGAYGKKWLKKQTHNSKSEQLAKRFGMWAALFSWVPFIGDPLMLILGFYKTKTWPTFLMMSAGKIARYGVIYCGYVYFS